MVMYIAVKPSGNVLNPAYYKQEQAFHLGAKCENMKIFCGGNGMPMLDFIYLDGDELTFVQTRFPTIPWRKKALDTYHRGQYLYGDMARMVIGNWED